MEKQNNKNLLYIAFIIGVVLLIFIVSSFIGASSKQKDKEITREQMDRDRQKIEYLDLFEEISLTTKLERIGGLSTYEMATYYFNVDDEESLKEWFFDGLTEEEIEVLKNGKTSCTENNIIFKSKKTKYSTGVPDTHIYVGICLEDRTNHVFESRIDHGFLNNYYEFMIGNWTKEEILEGINVKEVDFTSEEYSNYGPMIDSNYEKEPNTINDIKEDFIGNFKNSGFERKIAWHNQRGPHYHFFIENEEDLKEYFLKYSGTNNDDDTFNEFLQKIESKKCKDKETIFKFKETPKSRGAFDLQGLKRFRHIYIGICLEDSTNQLEIGAGDNGFYDNYIEYKVGEWTKEEIENN